MFRLLRKAIILGLAAFGAYRIYELVRPRAEQLAAGTGTQLGGAVATVSATAGRVQDVHRTPDSPLAEPVPTGAAQVGLG